HHLAAIQHPQSSYHGGAHEVGRRDVPSGDNSLCDDVQYAAGTKVFVSRSKTATTHRWVLVAAAVLLGLFVALGLAEATGTTQLTATVIRIFTPSGELIVETDDADVKITIEGDGGLVIHGAGPQEVRLRPGNYHVQADKNGKRVPLERELVSI